MTEHDEFKRRAKATPAAKAPYTFVETGQIVLASPVKDLDLSRPVDDALSGSLTVTWETETPLLVGGGDAKDENPDNCTPLKIGNQFALPGSTIKGLIRATMEIAAFARLSFVDDFTGHTHSYLDKTWKDEVKPARGDQHEGGWLFRTVDGYCLVQSARTEKIKIDDFLPLAEITDAPTWHEANMHTRQRAMNTASKQGLQPATDFGWEDTDLVQLVVAGQTADVDQNNKLAEYLFFWPDDPVVTVQIDKGTGDRFLASLHKDTNAHTGDPDANYNALITTGGVAGFAAGERPALATQLDQPACYGLPVFWRNPGVGNGNQTRCGQNPTLSLTALYRVPFKNTVHDLIKTTQNPLDDDTLDLVQALLGWAPPITPTDRIAERKKTQKSLRSRVRFGFALSNNARVETQTKTWAASRPKPSYWPYYLKANDPAAIHPVDYNNPHAILAGRKRYPVRGDTQPLNGGGDNAQTGDHRDSMEQDLTFLAPKAVFTSDIRFRNITPVELGALVFAITFGDLNGDGRFRHMIGRAKAFGYGQVKAAITNNTITSHRGDTQTLESALAAFTDWVKKGADTEFEALPSIRRLKGTAHIDTGARLIQHLCFPGAGAGDADGQKVLKAYGDLKKHMQEERRGGISGKNVKPDHEVGLPPYPGVPEE